MLRARPPGAGPAGFSLVELLVVVALVGILSLAILPEMAGTSADARLRASGREILAGLKLAHSLAVTRCRPHRLRVDRAQGRFWVEGPAEGGAPGFAPVKDVPGSEGRVDPRVRMEVVDSRGLEADGADGAEGGGRDPGLQGGARARWSPGLERTGGPRDGEAAGEAGEAISFRPDGTSEARSVLLTDREGFRLVLEVHPHTGRARPLEAPRGAVPPGEGGGGPP